ncbi:M56 family metallopeptidase [Undibacterium sp. Di24W]|uniref:M56 family metallopeptidase n=1 Tax=Undibacterium sp. Di24W TaxID=3413033 RepID=UPI003BEF6356
MLNHLSVSFLIFLLTYMLHSSLFLVLVFGLKKLQLLNNRRNAEWIWRAALFGGILTASLNLAYWSSSEPVTAPELNKVSSFSLQSQTEINTRPESNNKLEAPINLSIAPTLIPSQKDVNLRADYEAKYRIELPQQIQAIAPYLFLSWLVLAALISLQLAQQIQKLNRLSRKSSERGLNNLQIFITNHFPQQAKQIRLKLSSHWSSPVVTPNHTICLPKWFLHNLSVEEQQAVVAHEIAHVIRKDPAWNIANALIQRLFFFQPLNRIARAELSVLAELACDQIAGQHTGNHQELAMALYLCAQESQKQKLPNLALAMSHNISSLQRRIESLLSMNSSLTTHSQSNKKSAWQRVSVLGLKAGLCGILVGTALATPQIEIPKVPLNSKNTITNYASPALKQIREDRHSFQPSPTSELPSPTITTVSSSDTLSMQVPTLGNESGNGDNIKKAAKENSVTQNSIQQTQSSSTNKPTTQQQYTAWQEASIAYQKQDYANAFALLNPLAEASYPEAQSLIGEMYWQAQGVTEDHALAKIWFEKAAAQNNSHAQQRLQQLRVRQARQTELNFYTTDFNADHLKLSENKCPSPQIGLPSEVRKLNQASLQSINAWENCYNQFVEKLQQRFEQQTLVPDDLAVIMTNKELAQAKNLMKQTYLAIANEAKRDSLPIQRAIQSWDKERLALVAFADANTASTANILRLKAQKEFKQLQEQSSSKSDPYRNGLPGSLNRESSIVSNEFGWQHRGQIHPQDIQK